MSSLEHSPSSSQVPAHAEDPVLEEKPAAGPPAAKRPRYNDKAFGDLSINELEGAVKEANAYKKQCASMEEELNQLRGVRAEKAAMAKQLRALENELGSAQKEVEKTKSAIKDQDSAFNEHTDRVRKALKQTLYQQMVCPAGMKEKLQSEGREIVAFAANISPEVLKALGAAPGSVRKFADYFFGEQVTRAAQNGVKLVLNRNLTVKYVKGTCELRVDATYAVEGPKRNNAKPKKKGPRAAKRSKKEDPDGEDDEDEEDDGNDEEEDGQEDGNDSLPAEPAAAKVAEDAACGEAAPEGGA